MSIERVVICLVGQEARAHEETITNRLAEKYGLGLKQRTERGMNAQDAARLAKHVRAIKEASRAQRLLELEKAKLEAEAENAATGKTPRSGRNESPRKTPRKNSPRSSDESKTGGEEDGDEAEAAKLRQEARKQRAESRRQKRLDATDARMIRALQPHDDQDVVALSFLGMNGIASIQKAFLEDQEIRQLCQMTFNAAASDGDDDEEENTEEEEEEEDLDNQEHKEFDEEKEEKEEKESDDGRFNVLFPFSLECMELYQEFFFKPPPLADLQFESESRLTSRHAHKLPVKLEKVDFDQFMNFVFPKTQQHPWSTGRMLVFGEYGPLDTQGHMRSGLKGEHIAGKHEIHTIIKQIDKNDLLYIYVGDKILTPDEELEVLTQSDPQLRHDKQLSKDDIVALFEDLPRDEDGKLNFHEMQETIMKFREDRIKRWKQMSANSVRGKKKLSQLEKQQKRKHEKALRIASRLAFKEPERVDDIDAFLITSKLLNNHTYQICQMEDKNHPSLVQNVRILRNDRDFAAEHGAIPWNPNMKKKK